MAKLTEFMSNLFKKQKKTKDNEEIMFFEELTISYIEDGKNVVKVAKDVMATINRIESGAMVNLATSSDLTEREAIIIGEMVKDALS